MIIFDLDGTLALDEHRVYLLKQEKKDWDQYFKLCGLDELNYPIRQVLYALRDSGESIGLWTGRSASVRDLTEEWLERHEISLYLDQIRMRAVDDRTDDTELKRRWLHEQNATGNPVKLVFEDRKRVVDMWRSEGVVCCQVAHGDF